MNKIFLIILTVFCLLIFSCPNEIPVENIYTEQNDTSNDSTYFAELTNLTITAKTYQLSGSIASAADLDYYKFNISNVANLVIKTFLDDVEQTESFPLSFTEYNAADDIVAIQSLVAARTCSIKTTTTYIIFKISGNSDFPSGSYRIELKTAK